ncbi:hypothetical protein [Butyricimonas faecalis]|uniref:hypothetical protein n=1 Tax=Butyricimonas faecalis TaxID=2093856 RepID=UPI0013156527|nr:hypothetical protein [Butyricimonas faecalis]
MDDYSLFRPNLFYGATSSFGRWSYNCDNACFYSSRIDCVYNEIAGSDTEVRADEVWDKVKGRNGLPLVSIMNYRYYQ